LAREINGSQLASLDPDRDLAGRDTQLLGHRRHAHHLSFVLVNHAASSATHKKTPRKAPGELLCEGDGDSCADAGFSSFAGCWGGLDAPTKKKGDKSCR
jgi:hypothetical protein